MSQSLFSQPLNVINVGIAMFSDDLKKQHVEVTQLDWTPPGQGNMQVVQALDNIADSPLADKITAANQQALERIIQSHPVLIGFDQAINVVPGMTAKTILHAGPPVTWEKMCGAMKGAVTGALVFEGLAKDLDEAAELAGVKSAQQVRIRAAQSLGASRAQVLWFVILPGALPEILTGLRIGLGVGWSTLVAAELIAATRGLGFMVQSAGEFLATDVVLAGIAVIAIIAFLLELGLRALQRRLTPWHGEVQ